MYEIMKEKDAIYAKEDFTDEDGIRASELEGEFAEMNGWEAESDAAQLLNGLGIDTSIHYSIMKELNGSEKVKVLLAKALFGNPDILLLDEPTSAVDVETEELIQKALSNVMKGRTCITIAHRLSTVQNADCIYVVSGGKIAEHGKHAALLAANGVYAKLYKRSVMEVV